MAELFQTTRKNITLHISNIFKEKELIVDSVSKESLLTAADCRTYQLSQNLRQLHLMGKANKLNTTIWT
ncbi:hypothetical protein LX69_02981 [Breznakibacter xylanolyticus]|uniref:Uncharacterized protein n=1 Tax=Breznakibacter xylanolyticus TaxID=990 RepID=A0A2W7N0G0_9BACT|nr:hypothetical protein LX69_02981 [Breznakibacter xylanolyticus]